MDTKDKLIIFLQLLIPPCIGAIIFNIVYILFNIIFYVINMFFNFSILKSYLISKIIIVGIIIIGIKSTIYKCKKRNICISDIIVNILILIGYIFAGIFNLIY
jgi:hypothetical protein